MEATASDRTQRYRQAAQVLTAATLMSLALTDGKAPDCHPLEKALEEKDDPAAASRPAALISWPCVQVALHLQRNNNDDDDDENGPHVQTNISMEGCISLSMAEPGNTRLDNVILPTEPPPPFSSPPTTPLCTGCGTPLLPGQGGTSIRLHVTPPLTRTQRRRWGRQFRRHQLKKAKTTKAHRPTPDKDSLRQESRWKRVPGRFGGRSLAELERWWRHWRNYQTVRCGLCHHLARWGGIPRHSPPTSRPASNSAPQSTIEAGKAAPMVRTLAPPPWAPGPPVRAGRRTAGPTPPVTLLSHESSRIARAPKKRKKPSSNPHLAFLSSLNDR